MAWILAVMCRDSICTTKREENLLSRPKAQPVRKGGRLYYPGTTGELSGCHDCGKNTDGSKMDAPTRPAAI